MISSVQKIKRNNPLNIRASFIKWLGQVGSDNGFCVFSSLAYGYRAAYKLLLSRNYVNLNLKEAIFRWCPYGDGDNNPESYCKIVSKILFLNDSSDSDALMLEFSFKDLSLDYRCRLLSAMTKVESGVFVKPSTIYFFLKPMLYEK